MTEAEVESSEQYWLKPEQVEEMRNVIYECRPTYLQQRDDSIIAVMYDAGLRNEELCSLNVDDVDFDDSVIVLSPEQQKQYPNDNEPNIERIELAPSTIRTLRSYLNNRWKDTPALFPSRSADRITTRSVRNLVEKLAREAEIEPHGATGGRGDPSNVTPHVFRHSVAYRMVAREDESLDAVKRRLRHSTIRTTEREYSHFDVV